MKVSKANNYIMAKMQWLYIDELIALGYKALRIRSGIDSTIELTGPDGNSYLMYISILNDHNASDSVWVRAEICSVQGDINKSTSLISGFTLFSSGKIVGHP